MSDTSTVKEEFLALSDDQKWEVVASLKALVGKRDEDIRELRLLLALRTAVSFQPSSERLQQGLLFQELEVLGDVLESDIRTVSVKAHEKKAGKKRALEARPETPVYDVYPEEDPPAEIVRDGIVYELAEYDVVERLTHIRSRYVVERNHLPVYRPRDTEAAAGMNRVVLSRSPETDGLGLAPSFLSRCVVSKFDDHLPFYRQEEILRRDGISVSRQRMARDVIVYAQALSGLERFFKDEVYRSPLLNKDETPVQVLDVRTDSGKVSRNGYMNITVGTRYDGAERRCHSLVLVEYIQGRGADALLDDIRRRGYKGYVMTDGYKPYLQIQDRHCVCWVHAARGFKDMLKMSKDDREAAMMCALIARLYVIEDRWRARLEGGEIDSEGFLKGRAAEAVPAMESVFRYASEVAPRHADKSPMGKACRYLLSYEKGLRRYVECLECTPDNNRAEAVAKPFALGRRNWLFFKSVDGADASAFLFSLIETAKAYGLNPEDYMELVFTFGPGCRTDEEWKALLPWNADLSRLGRIREARAAAAPDPSRKKPYHFKGFTGQTVIKPGLS